MRSRTWKWVGLGALAAIAVGSAVAVEQRRRSRRWQEYDSDEIRRRLQERFHAIDEPDARDEPGVAPGTG